MAGRELTIVVQDEHTLSARSDSGREVTAGYSLSPWERDLIRVFQHWLARNKISEIEELEVLGGLLYRTLFSGEVGSLFEQERNQLQPGDRLRLQLTFQQAAADMAGYPWEFLYLPDTETRAGTFLAVDPDLVLSRYLPLNAPRERLVPPDPPLRLLLVVSEPKDGTLAPVLSGPVVDAIKRLAQKYPIEVRRLDAPTIDNFLDTIEETKAHVVHFVGHGSYDEVRQRGQIALLDDDEIGVAWVPDKRFADYFRQMRAVPRLIFLHNCEGAVNDATAKFSGLAPQLIRADVQAVVAMQYPITNRAAIDFSRAFYRQLARGRPVDDALQAGRGRMIGSQLYFNNRVFGTPVLYMRGRDGLIFPD